MLLVTILKYRLYEYGQNFSTAYTTVFVLGDAKSSIGVS